MVLLNLLQQLPLVGLFAATLAIGLAICWAVLAGVRFAVKRSGFDPSVILPVRDALINAVGAIFALMVAFSAAGIWNDSNQANTAVQRESNALENMLALAPSLPTDLADRLRDQVRDYTRLVVEKDWPAMQRSAAVDDPVYDAAERDLLGLIKMLSVEQSRLTSVPTVAPLLGQITEARTARLTRIAIAAAGVSSAQWIAMLLIALSALVVVAICHNHHFPVQVLATNLYTLAASAAFFVIMAHDRPFVGALAVSSAAFQHLIVPN